MKKYHKVLFLPENKTIAVEDRITIFETILENNPQNIQLHFACGSEGICQKCKIRAFQKMGPLTPTEKGCLSDEELRRGIRLACQARVVQDTAVEIIYKRPFTIDLVDEPVDEAIDICPRVEKIYMPPHGSSCLTPERLLEAVCAEGAIDVDRDSLAEALQEKFSGFFLGPVRDGTAVFIEGSLVCLEQGNTVDKKYAVAVDLGVNTLAASLVNVCNGRKVAIVTDTNPQIELGADFETRIAMIEQNPLNLEILNEELLLRIDILVFELCRAAGISPAYLYEIAVSGSTGMMHLFLKGVPGILEQQPRLSQQQGTMLTAETFDLKCPERARVYTLPAVSSYAGADITAGILATKLHRSEETVLLLDLGTAAKAVLHHQGKIFAASAPGCSVFEGAGISCGMRPESGAIWSVKINTEVHAHVIGESLARGICGSGLMELTAELKRLGIIDTSGAFQHERFPAPLSHDVLSCIINLDGIEAFRLYTDPGEFNTDISVTQDDIYELRKAKAQTVGMIAQLIDRMGIKADVVEKVLVAGAFGGSIDVEVLFELGMLPGIFRKKVFFVGNTSKRGAQIALLDKKILLEAERLIQDVVIVDPLSSDMPQSMLHFSSEAYVTLLNDPGLRL